MWLRGAFPTVCVKYVTGTDAGLPARLTSAVRALLHAPALPLDAASVLATPAAAECVERCVAQLAHVCASHVNVR